jgi:hypothetical protein
MYQSEERERKKEREKQPNRKMTSLRRNENDKR